jgi:outer membrane protein OmpA-like peptidoglycan-associated protein
LLRNGVDVFGISEFLGYNVWRANDATVIEIALELRFGAFMRRNGKSTLSSVICVAMGLGWSMAAFAQGLPSADELSTVDDFADLDEAARLQAEEQARQAEVQAQAQPSPVGARSAEPAQSEGPALAVEVAKRNGQNVGYEGAPGFHRLASARGSEVYSFRAAFLGELSSGRNVVRHNDTNDNLVGGLALHGMFHEHFSANLRVQARNNVNSFGRPQAMLSQGDLSLGLRGHLPLEGGVDLGADLTFYVPSSFGSAGFTGSAISTRPRLLATFDVGELVGPVGGKALPLDVHLNVGYRLDRSENLVPEGITLTRVERFAYDVRAYDMVEMGIGVEYHFPYVTPYLGWQLGIPVNGDPALCEGDRPLECVSDAGGASFPQYLSLGLRGEPIKNLGLHAGVDFGLTRTDAEGLPVTLPVNFMVGMSWTISPASARVVVEEREVEKIVEKMPPQGFVVGKVVNKQNGEPVGGALIEYLGKDLSHQASATLTGLFRSYGFTPGDEIVLRVNHPDYEPAQVVYLIESEGELELAIELEPAARTGRLFGVVTDADGAPIAGAVVRFSGANGGQITVGADGTFSQEIPAGVYTVAAFAKDYRTAGKDIRLAGNGQAEVAIILRPAQESLVEVSAEEIRIQDRIYFETGNAVLMERSFEVLNQVASVLLENPQIRRLQIEGHTDDVGPVEANLQLSQERSEAVRAYLISQGISGDRLTAKGFGSQAPLLPNTSNRNRSMNRRVEFKILE